MLTCHFLGIYLMIAKELELDEEAIEERRKDIEYHDMERNKVRNEKWNNRWEKGEN